MAIQVFVERRHSVQVVQWLGTEQCRADVIELFADRQPKITVDGSGHPWLSLSGREPVKIPPDYWVVRDHNSAVTFPPEEFAQRYEVMAP
jgi:hypothetical protein